MKTTRAGAAIALCAAVFSLGCEAKDATPSQNAVKAPAAIVNGSEETGYPAVGAMVFTWGGSGSYYCTGTLIDPSWVLTAGHCASFGPGSKAAAGLSFYIGTDATNVAEDDPNLYAVANLYPHPDYDPDLIVNDIALIELETPVDSSVATPIPVNFQSIETLEDEQAFYVGFGITTSLGGDGGGIKRSTSIQIDTVGEIEYSSNYSPTETGFCSGDSGGPGLYDVDGDGTYEVIGVNSTGSSSGSGDTCIGSYNDTRVDAFGEWIAETMGTAVPNCHEDTDICYCGGACTGAADAGVCDNTVCGTESCDTTFQCYWSCPTKACESDCITKATTDDAAAMSGLYACITDTDAGNCLSGASTYADIYNCMATSCQTEVGTCFDVAQCDPLGGDCDATTACRQQKTEYPSYGLTDCFATDTATYGQPCDGTATDPTSCPDGQYCLDSGNGLGAVCHQLCKEDTDCSLGGSECVTPILTAPYEDVGYCADDFTADTDVDAGADAGADADADTDADADAGADAGTGGSSDEDCGCSAVGTPSLFGSLLALIFG